MIYTYSPYVTMIHTYTIATTIKPLRPYITATLISMLYTDIHYATDTAIQDNTIPPLIQQAIHYDNSIAQQNIKLLYSQCNNKLIHYHIFEQQTMTIHTNIDTTIYAIPYITILIDTIYDEPHYY